MKNILITLLFILSFTFNTNKLSAQGPPPPPGGNGLSGNQSGGGAPIGSGIALLLSLSAAYGGRKVYKYWQDQKEELEA